MGRRAVALELSEAERAELLVRVSRRRTAQALAARARIVLPCAPGCVFHAMVGMDSTASWAGFPRDDGH